MVAYIAQLPVNFWYSQSQALQPSPMCAEERYFLVEARLWIIVADVNTCGCSKFTTEMWIGNDELREGVSYHLFSPDREEHKSCSGFCIENG
eukprot:1145967-Pelagomonas_calceolata.AAC.1